MFCSLSPGGDSGRDDARCKPELKLDESRVKGHGRWSMVAALLVATATLIAITGLLLAGAYRETKKAID